MCRVLQRHINKNIFHFSTCHPAEVCRTEERFETFFDTFQNVSIHKLLLQLSARGYMKLVLRIRIWCCSTFSYEFQQHLSTKFSNILLFMRKARSHKQSCTIPCKLRRSHFAVYPPRLFVSSGFRRHGKIYCSEQNQRKVFFWSWIKNQTTSLYSKLWRWKYEWQQA